jgi:hypothetical protein
MTEAEPYFEILCFFDQNEKMENIQRVCQFDYITFLETFRLL